MAENRIMASIRIGMCGVGEWCGRIEITFY